MKNMGQRRLRIVGGVSVDREARALAYGAWDVLDGAQAAASLADAVADCHLVAATSARAAGADVLSPRELGARAAGGRTAIVFGPEASGLTNEELGRCHVRVRVPTADEQPSLNLAQAVLLLTYELRLAGLAPVPARPPGVDAGTLETTIAALRQALLAIGYLNPDQPEAILAELRALLARASVTPRENALLLGIARQMAWAGRLRPRAGAADNVPPAASGGEEE